MRKVVSLLLVFLGAFLVIAIAVGGCSPRQSPVPNSISGHVYRSDGKTPIAGAWVQATGKMKGETHSAADGSYIIKGLTPGEYIIQAEVKGYAWKWYENVDWQSDIDRYAKKVSITEGQATTGINFRMEALASISGHVYHADAKRPIKNASVLVYGPHYSTGPLSAETLADGSYKVIGLNKGQSTVVARADGYAPRFYNGVYIPENATKVTTLFEKDTPNIDFYLEWGGSVSGRVYKPDGVTPDGETGIFYIQVSGIETPILGGCVPTPPCQSVETAADGIFRIGGLLSGDYELLAVSRHDRPSLVSDIRRTSVTLGKETQDINFVLGPRASISGHVYYSDGTTPVVGATVGAYGWCMFEHHVKTDTSGYYFIDSMVPGSYLVSALNLRGDFAKVTVSGGKETVHNIILKQNK